MFHWDVPLKGLPVPKCVPRCGSQGSLPGSTKKRNIAAKEGSSCFDT